MWNGFTPGLVVAPGLVVGALCIALGASAQEPARPTLILRQIVDGMPQGTQQEVQVLTAAFLPGQATVFHTHRFPVTVYVLEGAFTLEMEGRPAVTVSAGQSFVEPPGVRMTGYNRSPAAPLRVVVFYVGEPGTPFLDVHQH